METYAITVYVITEEVLRILNTQDDPQSKMSNAEVITFAFFHLLPSNLMRPVISQSIAFQYLIAKRIELIRESAFYNLVISVFLLRKNAISVESKCIWLSQTKGVQLKYIFGQVQRLMPLFYGRWS